MAYRHRFAVGLCALVACALLLGWALEAGAQTTTGKIAGRVVDAQTGEPLPGANVVAVGTQRGATADVNGEYFIIQMVPGTYELQASLVGYQTVTKTDVAVSVDRTVEVNFELQEAVIEAAEVTVVAERPPIEKDVSFTQRILAAEEVEQAPVGPRLRDAFATQVGVDTDSWGLTIRGADEEELLYALDGVGLKDNRTNRPFSSYSKTALSEVQILTGGFNAEYGDVRSGVVNILTREPRQWTISADVRLSPAGRKHFGPDVYSVDNWWDVGRFQSMAPTVDRDGDGKPDFDGWTQVWQDKGGPDGKWTAGVADDVIRTPEQARAIWEWEHRGINPQKLPALTHIEGEPVKEKKPIGGNLNAEDRESDYMYDITVGGPLVKDKVSLLLSARRERTAYPFYLATSSYRDNTNQVKAIFTPTPTTKLTLGYLRGWSDGTKSGNFLGTFVRTQQRAADLFSDDAIFMMGSQRNIEEITRNYGTLTWMHTLSPKTFYNVTARFGKTDFLAKWQKPQDIGVPVAAVFPDGRVEEHPEWVVRTAEGKIDKEASLANAAAARAQGAVVLDEAPAGWVYKPKKRDILGFYAIRGGGGGGRSADWSFIYENDFTFDITTQATPHHQLKGGFQVHHFYLREIRGYITTIPNKPKGLDDPPNYEGTQTADFHNYWVKFPLYGGFFLQDKMEFRQIVANVGVRLDFHRPDKFHDLPGDPHPGWLGHDAAGVYATARAVQPPTKWTLSPRFGISHPITVDSKLFFNYGHFRQIPPTVETYQQQSGLGEPLEHLGNPWMDMPQTIAYELGYERSFAGQYLGTGTVYFKDIEKEVTPTSGRTRYAGANNVGNPRLYINDTIKDVRGFELSLRKARGRFFTGFVSYDFRVERKRHVSWAQIRDVKTVSDKSLLRIEQSPSGANPRFKARPIWKVGLNLRTPLDYGGEARHLKGGWDFNLYYRRQAGKWTNYNPANDPALRNVDNVQWRATNMADLRISKSFDMPGAPTLYLEAHNLFNFKNWWATSDGSEVFRFRKTDRTKTFRTYMEALGWKVDSSGKLQEGDTPGKVLDNPSLMPRRDYLYFLDRRDVAFGLRFSY